MEVKESILKPTFVGIYGIPEAALYLSNTPPFTNGAKVSVARLRYWIRTSIPYVAPAVFPTRQRLITFLDLVSMRMIAMLRSRNIGLREIRQAEKFLRQRFDLKYPFASRPIWTCGSHIFVKFEEQLLAASKYGQQAMEFVRDWLSRVEVDMTFDEHDLASSWCPYQYISLNPQIQFGAPCISGTRVLTRSIWNKVKAGDDLEIVVALYDLTLPQVQQAMQWEKRIGTA